MSNIIDYRGYQAVIEFSSEDSTLFGKVMDIDDKIIFEIDNPCNAESIFQEVIDDYIELCKENSKEPCKPYKGVFNVRIDPSLHKKAVQIARNQHISLNAFVETSIKKSIENTPNQQTVNIYVCGKENSNNYSPRFNNQNITIPKSNSPDTYYRLTQ